MITKTMITTPADTPGPTHHGNCARASIHVPPTRLAEDALPDGTSLLHLQVVEILLRHQAAVGRPPRPDMHDRDPHRILSTCPADVHAVRVAPRASARNRFGPHPGPRPPRPPDRRLLRCHRPHRRGDYNGVLRVTRPRTAERTGRHLAGSNADRPIHQSLAGCWPQQSRLRGPEEGTSICGYFSRPARAGRRWPSRCRLPGCSSIASPARLTVMIHQPGQRERFTRRTRQ